QDTFAGCGHVNGATLDLNVSVRPAKVRYHLIVVSGNVKDARAFSRLAQNFLDDVVMSLRPVTAASHRPNVDQIANDVEVLEFVFPEEIEQNVGVRAASAEVHVGNPSAAP